MTAERETFVRRYGGIYEHSPWVAEQSFDEAAGVDDAASLARIFARHVDAQPGDVKLGLIRAHPGLAGKAAIAGTLTAASTVEQASSGLDRCSTEQFARLQDLNRRYKDRFGFPFVMAVRDSDREEILAAFERRLENDPETEFRTAIEEIHKIARLRLEAMLS